MLIVVPTPVGNLEDMTLRGLRALREADFIACEDTRRTLKLLNHYDIRKPLVSYHQHNERTRTAEIVRRVANGETCALVSDAGTPGISDPGHILIKEAIANALPVDVLPGANALLPALLLSGFVPQPFTFIGFLQGGDREQAERLRELASNPSTLVFYIAPHGVARTLEFFAREMPGRDAALVREISKIHQERLRGTLAELAEIARAREIRGELVLVVDARATGNEADKEGKEGEGENAAGVSWQTLALHMRAAEIFDREIANVLVASYGIPRNVVKKFLLERKESGGSEHGEP